MSQELAIMSGGSVSGAMRQTIHTSMSEQQGRISYGIGDGDQEDVQRRHVRKEYRESLRARR
jgi:hypothetical protein